MKRLHLFEWEDFSWVPRPIRDGGTDFLDFIFTKSQFYKGVAPELLFLIQRSNHKSIVDLCSGGGGGTLQMLALVKQQLPELRVILTDLHPNLAAKRRTESRNLKSLQYSERPVNALEENKDLNGIWTMSSALHHFQPGEVKRLIEARIRKGEPFGFFDVAADQSIRKLPLFTIPLVFLLNSIFIFLLAVLVTPFLRPFSLSRLFFTIFPAIPFLCAWDASVSALRAYTPDELLKLAQEGAGSERFVFKSGQAGKALFLVGYPIERAQ